MFYNKGMSRGVHIILAIVLAAVLLGVWFLVKGFTSGELSTPRTVTLYYYNPTLDRDALGNVMCNNMGLVPVTREVPLSITPIQDAVRLLIKGELTEEERAEGITTEYPLEGFSLKEAALQDGVLTLAFEDPNNRTGGGSCRVGILWHQIEATARQFPEVKNVRFVPEELFQP